MAIDSRVKRASVLGPGGPGYQLGVTSDATAPVAWRAAVARVYAGIAAGAAAAVAAAATYLVMRRRRRM